MTLVIGSLQLGLIYGLLALGVYITFRILNIPDLTADGSFTLGLAVSASFTVAGHPYLGILAAFLAGAAAGCVTGFLQTKVGIHPILAGILTMSGLYSVNLFVLGAKSNLSLIGNRHPVQQGAGNNAVSWEGRLQAADWVCFRGGMCSGPDLVLQDAAGTFHPCDRK